MTTIVPGLCSVTFRQLDSDQLIDVAARTGLSAIEWGADVHVPPGDLKRAAHVRDRCTTEGLTCLSYGSYWFAGKSPSDEIDDLLDTAVALGAGTVRVWAPGERSPAVAALARACDRAASRDLTIALEFHPNTLTETADSTIRLLADVDRPNLRTYWQPRPGDTGADAIRELEPVLSALEHLHVFSWNADSSRLPLAAHEETWLCALRMVARRPDDRPLNAYLEFVENDDPAVLARDAATLCAWIEQMA